MSLLLDALKKAAKEKQVADNNVENDGIETLELEASADDIAVDSQSAKSINDTTDDCVNDKPEVNESSLLEGVSATPLTVSDEALQVLVHKANRQYKSSQTMIWSGVLGTTLAVLIAGGGYFYFNMTEDVAMLEQKHRLMMRSVTDTHLSKEVTEKIEQQKALEEVRKKAAKLNNKMEVLPVDKSAVGLKKSNKKMVIEKKERLDPIDKLAINAWNAYEAKDYKTAKHIYTQILGREINNRDALLGIAAIAVKQGDIESAKSVYSELIQLNPRDSIAVAAISNLENKDLGQLGETKLKLMIRKNDNPSHLYFALGNIYSQQLRWPEAQQSYFNAWQSDNSNADYAFNLAVSLDQLGQEKQAINFYKQSLSNAKLGNTQFSIEAAESRLRQLSNGQ